jgi:spermidine/putrescine transport system ATP-binding protein
VADNIAFGLRERKVPAGERRDRVSRMLEMVELPGLESRMPGQLSGGQQQRVALARSLVIEPTVLLLDEPLGALDLRLRAQMQVELKRIQQHVGITFIYVTHDQDEALAMSDRIVVMNRGRIEQEGSAEDIFERPRTRFVASFMGARNILDVEITDRDPTAVRVRVGSRTLTLPERVPADVRTGALVIRPEKVRLDVEDGWPGTVNGRVYKGSMMSYEVQLDDGPGITADVAHDDVAHRHEIGEAVRVSFRAEDGVFIADRAGAPLASIPSS